MSGLYISYLPVLDPLAQSQVLPYIEAVAQSGVPMLLLTFEPHPRAKEMERQIRSDLKQKGILWRSLRYHKSPSLPATAWDILMGSFYAGWLILKHRVKVVHARAHVPAMIAMTVKKIFRIKMIFDLRGLMAEEYVDGGTWTENGIHFKLTKRMERHFFKQADAVVVLTEKIKDFLKSKGLLNGASTTVIPCCVDLERFPLYPHQQIESLRSELGLSHKKVLLYLGKLGGMYLPAQMVDFFLEAKKGLPDLHFLILTQSDHRLITDPLQGRSIAKDNYTLLTASPKEVPLYLQLADFGISFIKPEFSKTASSPTKLGEYLAAGLPVMANSGIGDCDELLSGNRVGIVIKNFNPETYRSALEAMSDLLSEGELIKKRCRTVAEDLLSLQKVGAPRYRQVYGLLKT